MEKWMRIPRPVSVTIAVIGAFVGLSFLMVSLASARTQVAPLDSAGTGTDPRIEAITVTSSLPISDTHPGDGVIKTAYFNNSAAGKITVTFEISGTPNLVFVAGAAFDEPGGYVGGSTSPQASFVVVYTVASTHTTQSNVTYTAINGVLTETSIAISYVRDVASPAVTVTAPEETSTLPFTVTWEAQDSGSGVASYTVAYCEDNGAWETWFPSTPITQASFVSATLNHTYVFSVTAYDQVGNWGVGTVTTQVGKHRVYLPIVMSNWAWWYQFDAYEPNDTRQQAYGPLVSGQVYTSYIYIADDQRDYYSVTVTSAGMITADLMVPACCDYDLYLYDSLTGSFVAASNFSGKGRDEQFDYLNAQPGTYYILVYSPFRDHSSSAVYELEITYPTTMMSQRGEPSWASVGGGERDAGIVPRAEPEIAIGLIPALGGACVLAGLRGWGRQRTILPPSICVALEFLVNRRHKGHKDCLNY